MMRLLLISAALIMLSISSLAQSPRRERSFIYSVPSEWQKVSLKPSAPAGTTAPRTTSGPVQQSSTTSRPSPQPDVAAPETVQPTTPSVPAESTTPNSGYSQRTPSSVPVTRPDPASARTTSPDFRPAFTGDFVTNRNGWKAGNSGDYQYQIGLGRYTIRRRKVSSHQIAFSHVALPADINLNSADLFTIKVDVLADSGKVPTGGVLFGVRDSLNFSAFTLNGKGEASLIHVANGQTLGNYMTGEFFNPGVPVERNRNRLTIRRKDNYLHFYINEQEIRTSPQPFKPLAGNDIGVITSAYWTSFQKFSVTLGPWGNDAPTVASTLNDAPAPDNASTAKPIDNAASGSTNFIELFANNQNRWLVGQKNGYDLDLMQGSYYIQKTNLTTPNPARSYVTLPPSVDLNKAESFTITADMIVPPGVQIDGGLLVGVKDVNTFCQFRLIGTNQVSIKSLTNGATFANYMPGKPTPPGMSVNRERNTLMIKKEMNLLHFYINGEEVQDSPHVFRKFGGTKIGFITSAKTVKFQNLKVQTESRK